MDESKKEFSMVDVFRIVWKYKWLIAICVGVCMAAALLKVEVFTDDTYTSNGEIRVSNHTQDIMLANSSVLYNDIVTSRTMASTCGHLLGSRTYLETISEQIGKKYSWIELSGMISLTSIEDTELISVSVTCGNPNDAYSIASAVISNAPAQLSKAFNYASIEIIDDAAYPLGRDSRQLARNLLIGLLIGLVLGIVLTTLLFVLDKRVHIDTDLQGRYDIPLLGKVINN